MPFYNYRCTNQDCQAETEVLHSMAGSCAVGCPSCGYPMKKLMSAVDFKFQDPRGTLKIRHGSGKSEKFT